MGFVIDLLRLFLVLGVLITIHELGHFASAKMFGLYCDEFSLGMGPKIYSKKFKETTFSLRALPIGGYVAVAGEEEETYGVEYERTLKGIAVWKRIVFFAAGAFLNIVLAVVIFFIVGLNVSGTATNILGEIIVDSPAYTAGVQTGDQIIKIEVNGKSYEIDVFTDMQAALQSSVNGANTEEPLKITLTVIRDGTQKEFTMMAAYDSERKAFPIGVHATFAAPTVTGAVKYAINQTIFVSQMIFDVLGRFFSKETFSQLSGPIGIFTAVSSQAEEGFINILYLTGTMSVNLGILNLLPIPALDGSRIIFTLVAKIRKKELNPNLENKILYAGFAVLMLLMLAVTLKDLVNLF